MKWMLPLLCFSLSSWACEILLPTRILISNQATGSSHKQAVNCEHTQIEELYSILRDQVGEIPLTRIQAALGKTITLKSNSFSIRIENVEKIIESHFSDLKNTQQEFKSQILGSYLELDANDRFEVNCHPCQFSGTEHFTLKITNLGQMRLSLDIPVRVFKQEEAIRLTTTLNAFTDKIKEDQWKITKAPAMNFGRYFNQPDKLKYFKTNKQLRAGDFIKESDLTPLNIVKAGDKVEITFENDHVKVKAQAISRQNGGIEDVVEVWNQSNGKKYKGVVTDFNHVTIKL